MMLYVYIIFHQSAQKRTPKIGTHLYYLLVYILLPERICIQPGHTLHMNNPEDRKHLLWTQVLKDYCCKNFDLAESYPNDKAIEF